MTYNVRTYVKPPEQHLSRTGYLRQVVAQVIRIQQGEAKGKSYLPFGPNADVVICGGKK